MSSLDEIIDKKIGQFRTESLDLSFGEIVNLHSNNEIIIQPEYQRLFRWSDEKKSRLIESIILELPIPQIFLIENYDGVLELIDGLQRVCSVIQFVAPSALPTIPLEEEMQPLTLEGCHLVEDLNGKKFEDFSLTLKLKIKRSSVRTVIIKRQSQSYLKYEMFKRLNTGGEILEPQEIRNCSARMVGEDGIKFYNFLQKQADHTGFKSCTETIAQVDKDKKADEELVLRFFAAKNASELFKGSVTDWLDDYMEEVILNKRTFEYEEEEKKFDGLFTFLNKVIGSGAFVRYRDNNPMGGLAPAYYEAVTVGVSCLLDQIINVDANLVKDEIINTLQTSIFRSNTGPGANKRTKLLGRINVIKNALIQLVK